ncbi:homoserine kinase [Floricoccus penangensis]|uniref:Homoserine kinase n=1 Tax=Floricoccus penangensis TaxID=1859475 RepID=A0A9Q5NZP6_9LACT|nr:homoserine kinase [Floricoccus penangensis]OFI46808.1 homoserine kinase [Floricoccus penangensis]
MKIRVPATSANIGPGFDSVGVALNLYLEIEVFEESDNWHIEHDLGDEIASDEKNLLISTALKISPELKARKIVMKSDIPLARGLGSSSSVIVAGIELANKLANLNLTDEEKLKFATEIEGHPDNVAPAIMGDLVIASTVADETTAIEAEFPNATFIAFIPSYELLTSDSRGVLPAELPYKEAVGASSIANVAIAALMEGDLNKAGKMIESDLFHEKYRRSLVKEFEAIRQIGHDKGAYATYLSGAGPTVMVIAPETVEKEIVSSIESLDLDGKVLSLKVDKEGVLCV